MLAIDVADVATLREIGPRRSWGARARSEEVHRLDEAGVVETAAFVYGSIDRGRGPLLRVALQSWTMFWAKGFEEDHLEEAGWPSIKPSGFT